MNAIEFIKTPFYISYFNNVVVPLTTIKLRISDIIMIATKTNTLLLVKKLASTVKGNINLFIGKINLLSVTTILGFVLIMYFIILKLLADSLDTISNKLKTQSEEIEYLKKENISLKKEDKLRELKELLLLEEIKTYNTESNKKFQNFEKKLRKLIRESEMYQ